MPSPSSRCGTAPSFVWLFLPAVLSAAQLSAAPVINDLLTWTAGASSLLAETPNGDGTSTVTYLSDAAIPDNGELFMRLRVEAMTPLP
jgi:hypothetical protein